MIGKKIYNFFKGAYYFFMPPVFKYHADGFIQHSRRIKKIYFSRPKVLSAPAQIQIQTTSLCNAECRICPYGSLKNSISHGTMPEELFNKIIDQCRRLHIADIYLYLMNEPLTDRRLPDLIRHAKRSIPDSRIAINTNATLLNKELAEELIKSGLDHITLSVHGWTEPTYNKITGLDFQPTYNNIQNFLALSKNSNIDIGLNCVWSSFFTVKDYIHAYEFSKRHRLNFFMWKPDNIASNVDPDNLKKTGIKDVKRTRLKRCLEDDRPFTTMHILYNGLAIACCMDWSRELVLGDANKQSLLDIWNGAAYGSFRDKISGRIHSEDNFICKRCSKGA